MEDLVAQLRAVGLANGLTAVGVAPAASFTRARTVLEERKKAGLHGGMHFTYGDPARSTDPDRALPGAAAIVVGAYRYLRDEAPGATDAAPNGRVARYSWQDHYAPLRDALGRVADVLVAAGWRARVLADDNALVDREAAYRAGLGWYGKNANLLLPGQGSWFVLGSVVTDAPLPVAQPLDDGCGACVRCLDACPTAAIVAPGVVDARRCLAWLLEAPGVFPSEHRVALGDRIYGCDDCQEVCPPNRTAARRDPPPPASAADEPWVDLLGLLDASDDVLLGHFGRWYIPRRQPRFLRRNALIAIGNTADGRDERVVAVLRRSLADPDPIVRGHAVWAAARLGRVDLVPDEDDDPGVRAELAAVAAGAVPPTTTPARGTPRNV